LPVCRSRQGEHNGDCDCQSYQAARVNGSNRLRLHPRPLRRGRVMKAAALAAAIEHDLLRPEQTRPDAAKCNTCGRAMICKPTVGDDSARFCSTRCRELYDAGCPAYDERRTTASPLSAWRVVAGPPEIEIGSQYDQALPRGTHGFLISCATCGRSFDSSGLRCCSAECERRYRERRENAALMAASGIDKPLKRKCQYCGGDIPNWRKGRRVSKGTRFCSRRCRARSKSAGAMSGPAAAVSGRKNAKKCR
jgi:hypothetical protein